MKLLLVDGNSIGYANQYGAKLTSASGMETQAIFGTIKTFRQLRLQYPEHAIRVLWDGRAQWRFDLLPEYKSNRSDDPKKVALKDAYKAQVPMLQSALTSLGIAQTTSMAHEADDLAGYAINSLSPNDPNRDVVLITGDQDWAQLVRLGVSWRDLRDDSRLINNQNFFDKTGYVNPIAFLEGKALVGDTSDVISGVGGIGPVRATTLLAEHGRVKNFLDKVDSGEIKPKAKWEINLASEEGRAIFKRNLRLMQLLKIPPVDKSQLNKVLGKFDADKFTDLCLELNFMSIVKNLENFLQPFERNQK